MHIISYQAPSFRRYSYSIIIELSIVSSATILPYPTLRRLPRQSSTNSKLPILINKHPRRHSSPQNLHIPQDLSIKFPRRSHLPQPLIKHHPVRPCKSLQIPPRIHRLTSPPRRNVRAIPQPHMRQPLGDFGREGPVLLLGLARRDFVGPLALVAFVAAAQAVHQDCGAGAGGAVAEDAVLGGPVEEDC